MPRPFLPHQWGRNVKQRRILRRAQISHVEMEVPFPLPGRRAQISHLEFLVPSAAPDPRRARVSQVELEAPTAPRRARVGQVSLEVPDAPPAPRRARISRLFLEVPDAAVTGAFARREVTSCVSWQGSAGAQSDIASIQIRWQRWETAEGVYDSAWENGIRASTDDAHAKGYKIVLRVFAGSDAPCGRPSDPSFPSWMLGGANPVEVIAMKANDSGGGAAEGDLINVPLAWDANYRFHYRRMLERLASILNETDSHGDARHNHILFIAAAMPTELGSEMTLGYGSFDPTFNRAAWDAVSTEAERRAAYTQAWKDCIDDHRELLPHTRVGLAGGHLFLDNWTGADNIILTKGGPQVVCMVTSLKDDYVNLHPNDHDYLLKGKSAGCFMGVQTASSSKLPHGQPLVNAAEFALETYDIHFFETQPDRFTNSTVWTLDPTGGWPGDDATMKTYLVDHASDLQSRLVP